MYRAHQLMIDETVRDAVKLNQNSTNWVIIHQEEKDVHIQVNLDDYSRAIIAVAICCW
jgi:hypothetical protein